MGAAFRPQPGPQESFLATPADIAVYGGAAGGGKSWAILAEPLRHIDNPHFGAVVFRRNSVQVRNKGGLWDGDLLEADVELVGQYQMCSVKQKALADWLK